MKSPTIVKRGRITYVLYNDKVAVGIDEHQWIGYDQHNNWNRSGITQFKQKILKSKEDQYDTPSAQMTLAMECEIIGVGTFKPKEL